jgi:hypothetical protein
VDVSVQDRNGAWVGILEFKRMQAPAELQLVKYFYDELNLRRRHYQHAMKTTRAACVSLEVVGNEMRYDSKRQLYFMSLLCRLALPPPTGAYYSRLGAFWFEKTICTARLGSAEFRLDSTVEERRAAATLLRSWLQLVGEISEARQSPITERPELETWLTEGVPYALAYNARCDIGYGLCLVLVSLND